MRRDPTTVSTDRGTTLDLTLLCVSAFLACVVGFAAHRASLCSVRAVEELITTRRAFMLASFVKMALWVIGATLLAAWVLPGEIVPASGWKLSILTIGGGLLFGVGATINRGCAFSTLTRLGGGDVGMVVSLVGFIAGAGVHGLLTASGLTLALVEARPALSMEGSWRLPVTLVLALWMVWQLVRLLRIDSRGGWSQRLVASRYRLSTAAALMGLSNAVLYILIGVWPYTRVLGQTAREVTIGAPASSVVLWLLFGALIGGVGLSAWQGRRFSWQWRPRRSWLGYCAGGVLMGFGAAMIPGGNDVIILHGIPSLSPHAVPAFLAMLVGIALSLLSTRALGRSIPKVDCSGDICGR